ncbi:hypothetical protein KI387_002186, partial [Taxus chinensis]
MENLGRKYAEDATQPDRAGRRNLSQTVRDSWDKGTQRTRTTRIGQNRELSSGTVGTKGRVG